MKQNFLSNKFDRSEDHLAFDRLYKLVGQKLVKFKELVKSAHLENIKALIKMITPSKDVSTILQAVATPNKEAGLFSCDGEQLDVHQQGADEAIKEESSTVPLQWTLLLTKERLPHEVMSLATLTSDPVFCADSQLFDGLYTLTSEYEKFGAGSVLFTPFVKGMWPLPSKARKSLKKCLATNSDLTESLSSNGVQPQTTKSATVKPATVPGRKVDPGVCVCVVCVCVCVWGGGGGGGFP